MSLSVEEAASEALARWLGMTARPGQPCLGMKLPTLDFPRFFETLARSIEHEPQDFALCAAGFDLDEPTLRAMAERAGLHFHDVATHLQRAATWRNLSDATILAIARGEPDGGNTLQEFKKATSGELASVLLRWLADPEHEFSDARQAPEVHGRLLDLISKQPPPALVLSLEGVCHFAAAWAAARASGDAQTRNDAPLLALPELSVAWDGDLFNTRGDSDERRRESLRENLIRALQSTQEVLALSDKELDKLATRAARADAADQPAYETLLTAIREAQRGPTAERLRRIRLDHYRKLTWTPRPRPLPPTESSLDWSDVERAVVDRLLGKDEEHCQRLFAAILEAEPDQGVRELLWDFGDGQETLSLATLRPEAEAIITLGGPDIWGAAAHFVRDQPTPALLRQLPASRLTYNRPGEIVFTDDQTGDTYDLPHLLAVWDGFALPQLSGDATLVDLWQRWVAARSELLTQQEWLFLSPLTLLAGDASARQQTKALLDASAALYDRVATAREAMQDAWQLGAEALFQALLSLDVVQVRVVTGKRSTATNRLILLPTHPLQLWRSHTFVMKCLEAPSDVDEKTRGAIVASLDRTDLYLPAWFASRLPQSEGADKLLPFAGVLGGLAVFQNLDNSVAVTDGAEDIRNALARFAAIHPEFCRPLRVTVVNPPDPERLLPCLAECLETNKGPERLELTFVATGRLRARLAETQRLYLATGGELGDAIDSGQLSLQLGELGGEGPRLEELVRGLAKTPGHVLVIFDEADIDLQRRGLRGHLPMSPFTVTRELRQIGPRTAPRLELQATFTDELFSGMQRLINSVDGSPGESLSASISATNYIGAIHAALLEEEFSALWVIIADRALPGAALLRCKPLFHVRRRVREVGVFCRDLAWLARRVRAAFRECNLDLQESDLEGLLHDGAALLAGGLLDLVQVRDGAPNRSFVQGLAGTLFVARAWKQQHPEGLLLTVDSPVARSWLGLGENSLRSDLIGIWEHQGQLEVEIIEVKTSHDPVPMERVDEAVTQVLTTLRAVDHGLNGSDVLAVPRREMLKEVLKQAVDAAPFERDPGVRQRRQQRWIEWLLRLVGEDRPRPAVLLSGRVVCVHLRDRNPPVDSTRTVDSRTVRIECLGEEQCLALGLGLASESRHNRAGEPPSAPISQPSPTTVPSPEAPATPLPTTPLLHPDIVLGEKPGGGAVHWQPFREGRPIYNPHTVIVGGSGSGKTETLKVFLLELRRCSVGCLVFDFKDDYVQPGFVEQLGATVHLAEDGLPVNPMVPGFDSLTGRTDITNHVFTIESTLTKVYNLGDQQANTLRQALFAVYDRAGFLRTPAVAAPGLQLPAFADIRAELEQVEATTLLGRLQPIFDLNLFRPDRGALNELFTGTHIIRFTRLPGEEVKKACAEIVLRGCYNEILRLGHHAGLRFALMIDEAHRIANLAAVSLLLREARSYGVGVFLSSQQARDFADDIYSNADTLVGLKLNEPRDAERMGALLAGSGRGREIADVIRHLQPGEALMKNAAYMPYVRFRVTPLSLRPPSVGT